jgi:hypothetical protein
MDVSDSQLVASLLENRRDSVANGSELPSAVQCYAVHRAITALYLLPVASHETLIEGRKVVV